MSNNEKYTIKELSFHEMLNDLSNISPLMMSKKLIEYELYDQQDSIEVLNSIYEEFESRDNVIDNLVNPMLLSVADGLIKHPKLGLEKTGIKTERLLNEIKNFNYEDKHSSKRDIIQDKMNLDQNSKFNTVYHIDKNGKEQKSRVYIRDKYEDKNRMSAYKDNYLKTKSRDEYTNENKVAEKRPQPDHIVALKHAIKEYGTSKFLNDNELKLVLNKDENFAVTNGSLNQSKGSKTNTTAISENKNTIAANQSKETKVRMIKKEKEATRFVEKELNKKVADNLLKDTFYGNGQLLNDTKKQAINDSTHKAIGEVLILLIKPIYYEFSDIFKNGVISNLNVSDKVEAFILRMKRVKDYVLKNSIETIFDNIKDFLQSFVTLLINGIVNAFVGLLKKILQVISEGFTAIVEAFKIMMKPNSEITLAQKADAITKIIASAVVPILIFSFEETILVGLKFLNGTPLEFLKDVAMIILSGLATTLVVWILDQIDLFSVKGEKRLARVKEIFELRIETIKKNTDIFEKTSIEILAKQKLQFKNIINNMNIAIERNQDINSSVYEIANFMKIDLKVKSTDEFLNLISNSKNLIIGEDNFQRDIKLSQLRQLLINYSLLKSKLL
ncbi:hypothetical protein PT520_11355 [Aliarcobacter butzleri]|uniref:Uncharacterized protein n=1 Tax=Aliarcobacter butzleri TaxID=28197 RepID=A0AAW6VRD1_9BACT|nr:hypothetical protein [Aliarcobacter butzleri]MDK2063112.1 hypothetical protein [Aliarcobacter butzleri]